MAINGSLFESTTGYFSVKVESREVITPQIALPQSWLPLSNLDLLLPPIDVSTYFVYRKPSNTELPFDAVAGKFKRSLSQILVHYYPLAGEMVVNSTDEPELFCNNSGVEFIEAHADIELNGLILHDPDATVQGKFIPVRTRGVLCVQLYAISGNFLLTSNWLGQVTKLECGGIVVACTFDHRVADAYSINMFMAAWIEMVRTSSLTLIPNFRRSLLSPRRPGSYDKSVTNMYIPIASLTLPAESSTSPDQFISRIYHLSANDMDHLQNLACTTGSRVTKLEAFSAFLWKIIANASGDAASCRLGIVVDGRSRLSDGKEPTSSMLWTYLGNILTIPFGEASVEDIKTKPLCWVANQVHELLGSATNKEHLQGLIDYVEGQRPNPMMTRVYYRAPCDGPAIVVSYARLFDAKRVDFGWGTPMLALGHFPWGGDARYVLMFPNPLNNGDWVVYMHLFKHQLHEIETVQGGIFQPLRVQHLTPSAEES